MWVTRSRGVSQFSQFLSARYTLMTGTGASVRRANPGGQSFLGRNNVNELHGAFAGHVESSIGAFVLSAEPFFLACPFVLLAVLDSSTRVGELPSVKRALASQGIVARGDARALLITGNEFVRLARPEERLLNGFDEVWLAESANVRHLRPVRITGDVDLGTHEVPSALFESMAGCDCFLGLGDGLGMNYVSTRRSLAQRIEGLATSP